MFLVRSARMKSTASVEMDAKRSSGKSRFTCEMFSIVSCFELPANGAHPVSMTYANTPTLLSQAHHVFYCRDDTSTAEHQFTCFTFQVRTDKIIGNMFREKLNIQTRLPLFAINILFCLTLDGTMVWPSPLTESERFDP